jgi:FSR family fosmidomycin resistance protein-like MFS transporter
VKTAVSRTLFRAAFRAAVVGFLAIELLDELVFGAREAALPSIRTDLGLSYAEIGVALALPNVASALAEPLLGLLGDLWRRRLLVVGGGVAYGLALLLLAGAAGFWMLLVSFMILYPASGAFVSLAQASFMDSAPERRERNMLRWTLAAYVGALAGPPLVGLALALGVGWRPVFAGLGLLALAIAVGSTRLPLAAAPAEPGAAGLRSAVRALRNRAVVWWLVLLEAADSLGDVLFAFLALYLVDEVGLTGAEAALVLTAWLGAGLAGNLAALRIVDRVGGLRLVRATAAAAVVVYAGFLLVEPFGLKLALLLALGVLVAGWYPVLKARLYAQLPGRSGTVMAAAGAFDLVAIVPPLAVGLAANRYGLDVALWLLLAGPLVLLAGLRPAREAAVR